MREGQSSQGRTKANVHCCFCLCITITVTLRGVWIESCMYMNINTLARPFADRFVALHSETGACRHDEEVSRGPL